MAIAANVCNQFESATLVNETKVPFSPGGHLLETPLGHNMFVGV